MNIPKKAVAATSGASIGGAVAVLIVALWWPNADAVAVAALTTIANAVIAGIGAYLPKMEG